MPVALQDIRAGEPFAFEFDSEQGQDDQTATYQGEKVYQRPDGKALIKFSSVELGIGNRVSHLSPDVWYCIADPLEPGYFMRLDCFNLQYWRFKNMSPKEIMAFGAANPDELEKYRMRIISENQGDENFRVGRA
jgi:hypothetical protein